MRACSYWNTLVFCCPSNMSKFYKNKPVYLCKYTNTKKPLVFALTSTAASTNIGA